MSYSEEREEIQQSIKEYKKGLNAQVRSSTNIFKNGSKKFLLGITVVSVAVIVGGWVSRPKKSAQEVIYRDSEENEIDAAPKQQVRAVKNKNSIVTMVKNELASFLITLLKENINVLLRELPTILANHNKNSQSENKED